MCIAKFHRDCEIFAMVAKFSLCHSENPALPALPPESIQPLFLQFLLTFIHPSLMKSSRIRKIRHQYEAKLEIMAEVLKTCETIKNNLETTSVVLNGPAQVNWLNSYD